MAGGWVGVPIGHSRDSKWGERTLNAEEGRII
jgi:hypothetical protein